MADERDQQADLAGTRAASAYIDEDAWNRTVEIAQNTPNLEGATVLTAPPTDGAYTNDIVNAANALLADSGLDLMGADYAPIDVTLNAGGN